MPRRASKSGCTPPQPALSNFRTCNKPFGVKSTIERVAARLEGKHWMYASATKRLDVIKMCENCRVAAVTEEDFDPHGASARPKLRTTEDYLREREVKSDD